MNLAIDIGNTRVKTGVFEENKLLHFKSILLPNISDHLNKIQDKFNITKAITCSVGKENRAVEKLLEGSLNVLHLSHKTHLPFKNKYKTPESLGVDRIALMAAAVQQFPNKNVLVIDAGSCITYDFIDKENQYSGGYIAPGIEMRYKSLNSFTQNLPKLSPILTLPKVGNTTENAMHIGVLSGVIQEIEGHIQQFKAKNKKLTVVLTGGDTIFLAKNIKSTIFANPNFLLEGLNSILIFNKDL